MITHGTGHGISVEQIAKVWGVSRDEAFARLHGDEPEPSHELPEQEAPAQATSSRVSWAAGMARQALAS
jgi:hypothetical protein